MVDICIKHIDVQLGALYTNFNDDDCDPDCPRASDPSVNVQHRLLQGYTSPASRAAAEYRVFRHIVYPLRQRLAGGSGSFLARSPSTTGNDVDVILTGSSCHACDLRLNKLSSVIYIRMSVDSFRQRYLQPLEAKALRRLSATKLQR